MVAEAEEDGRGHTYGSGGDVTFKDLADYRLGQPRTWPPWTKAACQVSAGVLGLSPFLRKDILVR